MRRILMGGLCVAALGLSACATRVDVDAFEPSKTSGAPLRAVAALDCPTTEGSLTRVGQSPDGQSCDYQGRSGEQVRLRLLALDGLTASDALEPSKAELRSLMPIPNHHIPGVPSTEAGEHAAVDMPFFHVRTLGDRAEVKIFGVTIHTDGEKAEVRAGAGGTHTVVHASPGGAEVVTEDVGRTNASLVYVLASDTPSRAGYKAVGYVAKGPVDGPLVVAEFRAMRRMDDRGGPSHHNNDLDRLIARNVRS